MTGPQETYGPYGGRYVPETLVPALDELAASHAAVSSSSAGISVSGT